MENLKLRVEDVKVDQLVTPGGITFNLFTLQASFMTYLSSKGKIPAEYPLDLSQKSQQKVMRENISCHVEEMMEMHEVYEMMHGLSAENIDKDLPNLLQKFNVEQADSLHFWLELFIFMDIGPTDLKEYYLILNQNRGIPTNPSDDALAMSLTYAEYLQNEDKEIRLDYFKRASYRILANRDIKGNDLNHAGVLVGSDILKLSEKYLFKVSYYLYLAMGLLKGKYWREEEIGVNQETFEKYVMEAWIYYTLYLNLHGFKADQMFITYFRKNEVNKHRQLNGW